MYVITGDAMVNALGTNANEVVSRALQGYDGAAPMQEFGRTESEQEWAYQVAHDGYAPEPSRVLRATDLLDLAVRQVLPTEFSPSDSDAIPIYVGTTLREQRSIELWSEGRAAASSDHLDFGAELARRCGAGEVVTLSNACAASLTAVAFACDRLHEGDVNQVIAAGVDVLTRSTVAMMGQVQSGGPARCRPFAPDDKGMVFGEGAAAIAIRRYRDSEPSGTVCIRSVAVGSDAKDPVAPDFDGICRTVREAHARAGIGPGDVDLIMAHGTGTEHNDSVEVAVIAEIFQVAKSPPVAAIKSVTGHNLGASGLTSLIFAAHFAQRGCVPAIVGVSTSIDATHRVDFVLGSHRAIQPRILQVNSFGLSGITAVAILEIIR